MKKKNIILFIVSIILLYLCIMAILIHISNSGTVSKLKITEPTSAPTDTLRTEKINIVVMGDNLMHVPVFSSCKIGENEYDLHPLYEHMQPLIKDADLAVIGQETLLAGSQYGYTGYPSFNSPQDVGKTLVNEGFDLILCASNHAMDKGGDAVLSTMDFWENYSNITTIGFNRSFEEQDNIKVLDIKGVKIAVLNYTYGTNGIPLPIGREYLINIIDKDKIAKDVEKAKKISDYIIVFPHWGTEYSVTADNEQTSLAQYMADLGVNMIIGSHPHVMEPTDILTGKNGNKTVVYYSLGNYVSSQQKAVNLLGGTAIITLNAEFKDDKVNVKTDDAKLMVTITHYNSSKTKFTVYPLIDYNDGLASQNGVSMTDGSITVERLRNIIDNIFTEKNKVELIY